MLLLENSDNRHAYHILIVHKLEAEDYATQQAIFYDLLKSVKKENLKRVNTLIYVDGTNNGILPSVQCILSDRLSTVK